jgi:diadenosine tetraphosphatase ApaH/serine/threonine PP2A family protein phosphatase
MIPVLLRKVPEMGDDYYHGGGLEFDAIREQMDAGKILSEDEVAQILATLSTLLYQEDNVLVLQSPIVIVGDVHGQYEDLKLLFELAAQNNPTGRYLFMGDYVDRGHYSLNTFLLLATYKIQYPTQYFLLRGNHESRQVTQQYGFHAEIFGNYGHVGLWTKAMLIFDLLPFAAVVDNDILSVHGGISPRLPFVSQINSKKRMNEISNKGGLADLVWSDPEDGGSLLYRPNQRGAGFIFGREAVMKFCTNNKLRLITRSHQLVMEGFKWFFGDEGVCTGRLINVWSAPNYAYTSGNEASFLRVRYAGDEEFRPVTFSAEVQNKRIAAVEADISKYFA